MNSNAQTLKNFLHTSTLEKFQEVTLETFNQVKKLPPVRRLGIV